MTSNFEPCPSKDGELSVAEVIAFLRKNSLLICATSLVTVIATCAYSALKPVTFEASVMLRMAGYRSTGSNLNSMYVEPPTHMYTESPALLIERLKRPQTFSPEVIKACGLNGGDQSPLIARTVQISTIKSVPDVVEVRVRHAGRDVAAQCLNSIIGMLRAQQNDLLTPYKSSQEKALVTLQARLDKSRAKMPPLKSGATSYSAFFARGDEQTFLLQQIGDIERSLSHIVETRQITPVQIDQGNSGAFLRPVFLLASIGLGAILGIAAALFRNLFSKRRH